MAQLSIADAAEAWVSLARQAQSTALDMDSALANKRGAASVHPTIDELAFVSTRLQQFSLHAQQLGECLADALAVSTGFHVAIAEVLPDCTAAVTHIFDQSRKLTLDTPPRLIDPSAPLRYGDALAAISRMVIFATQLATIDSPEEQAERLHHYEAKELFDNSRAAIAVVSPGEIFAVPN